jgi:hypothetical protein
VWRSAAWPKKAATRDSSPAYSSLVRPPRSLVSVLARLFGVGGTGDGIDFARVGATLGLVSGVLGFVVGILAIVSGMVGVVGGMLGVVSSGLLGIVAGGVLGVVLGGAVGAVGTGIVLRDWNFQGSFGALMKRVAGGDAGLAASSPAAAVSWRVMRVASGLMPRAAGRRWLAEAESFLFEAPAGHRRRAIRNYLLTAPLVMAMGWIRALTRRTRLTGSKATAGTCNASGDPGS